MSSPRSVAADMIYRRRRDASVEPFNVSTRIRQPIDYDVSCTIEYGGYSGLPVHGRYLWSLAAEALDVRLTGD